MSARSFASLALLFGAGSCALMGSFDGDYQLADTTGPVTDDDGSDGSGGESDGSGGQDATGAGGSGAGEPVSCEASCPTGRCVQDQCVPWSVTYSGGGFVRAAGVGTSRSGEVIVAGDFDVQVVIGTQSMSSNGMNDVFVARYARDGELQWAKSFGGADFDELGGLAVDEDGDSYLAMRCQYVNVPGFGTIGTGGGDDICVVRLGPGGDVVWARSFGQGGWESVNDIAVSGDGVFIAGRYDGYIDFDGHYLSGGSSSGYVVRVGKADGQAVWAVDIPSPVYAEATAVDARDGKVVVGGRYGSWTDIGGFMLNDDDGIDDLFVAALNPQSGATQWARRLHNAPSGGWAELTDVAIVGNDAVITGSFQGPWNFGGPPVSSQNSEGYVARIHAQGRVWFHAIEGSFFSEITGVDVDANGGVVMTGTFDGDMSHMGPYALQTEPNMFGAFFGHIDKDGELLGAEALTGAGAEYIAAPHLHDGNDNLLMVGDFDGTLNLGGTQHVANGWDGYLVSYGAL